MSLILRRAVRRQADALRVNRAVGSPKIIKEMLDFAAEKDIKPWIVKRPLKDANQAVVDMHASKARYRCVFMPRCSFFLTGCSPHSPVGCADSSLSCSYVLINEENGGKF